MAFIFSSIKRLVEHRNNEANAAAKPTLYLLAKVHGLAGGKKQLELSDYVPFPDSSDRMSPHTAEVISALRIAGEVPDHVFNAMGKYVDDLTLPE